MKCVAKRTMITGLMLISMGAGASNFDGSKPMLCATQTVNECLSGTGCSAVDAQSVAIPDFFRVEAAENVIRGMNAETRIERVEHLDGKLVLQGADDGLEDVRDGIAWSMVIDEDTGKMILNASGNDFSVVVFGACMKR
jgi:hypothetical protein